MSKNFFFLLAGLASCSPENDQEKGKAEIWGDSATGWRVEAHKGGKMFFKWSDSVSDTPAMKQAAEKWLKSRPE